MNVQIEKLKDIPKPSDLEEDSEAISSMTAVLIKVKDSINKVVDYISKITKKLDDMRDMIKEYELDIASNLESIMKKYLLEGMLIN
jgi:DNA anti-recombination protein RmuC